MKLGRLPLAPPRPEQALAVTLYPCNQAEWRRHPHRRAAESKKNMPLSSPVNDIIHSTAAALTCLMLIVVELALVALAVAFFERHVVGSAGHPPIPLPSVRDVRVPSFASVPKSAGRLAQ